MASNFPASHVILPQQPHTHTIILLHGRNSTGPEFAEEILEGTTSSGKQLSAHDTLQGCKWIFPTACSTFSQQFQEDLTEWFDLPSTSDPYAELERQIPGLTASVAYIKSIIEVELQSLPTNRIILGGISQGFATAVHVLLSGRLQLGGFIGCSGWLPFYPQLSSPEHSTNEVLQRLQQSHAEILEFPRFIPSVAKTTPILVTHSQDDEVIDVQLGRDAHSALSLFGTEVTMKEYARGGHEIAEPHGFDDILDFLKMNIRNNGR